MSAAIRIVLVDTSHPGNIGACARAMKNMGLESLVLVRPQAYPDAEATARASGAVDLLARARVCAGVDEAIGDCGLVLGTTARSRSANWRVLDARVAAAEAVAAAAAKPVAILFGGERNGLANEALERCQALVRIPADDAYDALNLAQAVQILCYEIRMAMPAASSGAGGLAALATADEMQALQAHVERVMRLSGFMHAGNAVQLGARVRRLMARALPDDGEVRILRGWLAAIERRLGPAE
ncbi:MAG TPA: RNA methyltransferase [Steroidobacteraceae bacterium]|jgi:TrmH family RNA methyltransferase